MTILTKKFEFEAAHQLPWHKGKCSQLHGHTYKLEVSIAGELNKDGVVMDFGEIKDIVQEKVISKLDHSYLNDVIQNPTAENLITWIAEQIEKPIQEKAAKLYKIKLYETTNSSSERFF